jgi:hypothetical protein
MTQDMIAAETHYAGHSMHAAADDSNLRGDLSTVLNRYSRDNGSNTPDFILAQYLANCLDAFDIAVQKRAQWFGRMDTIGGSLPYANAAPENQK